MQQNGGLDADIVAVVSNHLNGGVQEKAERYSVPFIHFPLPHNADHYQQLIRETGAKWTALSGWLKQVSGLDPRTTFNIHPGPLPEFGGPGMYGHHVHEAVIKAYREGHWKHRFSEVCMHFVTEKYDDGPVCYRRAVSFEHNTTPEELAGLVNKVEHHFQYQITDMILREEISWNGVNPASLRVPSHMHLERAVS